MLSENKTAESSDARIIVDFSTCRGTLYKQARKSWQDAGFPDIETAWNVLRRECLRLQRLRHAELSAAEQEKNDLGINVVAEMQTVDWYPKYVEHARKITERIPGSDPFCDVFHTYDEVMNQPPPQWLIKNLVQEDEITLFGGLSGHGKTWIMLSVVRALLTGRPLFGYHDFTVFKRAERVIYLIPEVGLRSFSARLKRFHLEGYIERKKLLIRTLSMKGRFPKLNNPSVLTAARGAHVFLDTAIRFMEGDENSASESSKNLSQDIFNLLSAGAISVFAAHHSSKSFRSEHSMELETALRGSGEFGAMSFNTYGVKLLDKKRNIVYIECVKARDLPETPPPFQIEGRPWIDQEGDFRMFKNPGECGTLSQEQKNKGGRPSIAEKDPKIAEAFRLKDEGKSIREIADILSISKTLVGRWLKDFVGKEN